MYLQFSLCFFLQFFFFAGFKFDAQPFSYAHGCRQTEEERLRLSLYEGCTEIQMDGWTDGHTDGPRTDSHTEITPCSTGFVPFRAIAKKEMLPALFSSSGCDKKLILYCVLRLINVIKREMQRKL